MDGQQLEDLAYDVYQEDEDDVFTKPLSPVVIFHAAFDHKGNWAEIAKEIAEKTVRKVYVLDMRDHGDSPKTTNVDHQTNLKDLENFLLKLDQAVVLMGHSLGGTAAIDLSFKKPELVEELILVDISPLRYPENEEEQGLNLIAQMKCILALMPRDIEFLKAKFLLQDKIKEAIKIPSYQKLLFSNLVHDCHGWKWKVNIDSLENLGHTKAMRKVYPIRGSFGGKTLLLHSDSSEYVRPNEDYPALKIIFPKISIQRIENCNHLIHLEKPDQLTRAIVQHLNNLAL